MSVSYKCRASEQESKRGCVQSQSQARARARSENEKNAIPCMPMYKTCAPCLASLSLHPLGTQSVRQPAQCSSPAQPKRQTDHDKMREEMEMKKKKKKTRKRKQDERKKQIAREKTQKQKQQDQQTATAITAPVAPMEAILLFFRGVPDTTSSCQALGGWCGATCPIPRPRDQDMIKTNAPSSHPTSRRAKPEHASKPSSLPKSPSTQSFYSSSGSAPTMLYCPPAPAKTIFLSRMALFSIRVGASISSVVPCPVW